MNDYEAHLSSYDHSHKQRLKDMRQLTRDPLATEKARKAEAKANAGSGLISIKIGEGGSAKKGGFKKAGFKSAFALAEESGVKDESMGEQKGAGEGKRAVAEAKVVGYEALEVESDTEDEGYEMYDPRHPTD
jgi:hypothetical protein